MKTATYTLLDGTQKTVEYDENGPCIRCGEPVIEASMSGTVVCPWCDMGIYRDGHPRLEWPDRMLKPLSDQP